ncbi:MAG TPA: hypothetical protein DCQ37_24215 [Desulfobacteraceae bacterium]|nr:hypothetical protein [Desulfobacteraceae bacterium]
MGFSYSQLGLYKEAVDAFKTALKLVPRAAQIHYNIAYAYSKLGRHQESIEALINAIRINPDYATARYSLGVKYLSMGNKDGATEQYSLMKKTDPVRAKKLFSMIEK